MLDRVSPRLREETARSSCTYYVRKKTKIFFREEKRK